MSNFLQCTNPAPARISMAKCGLIAHMRLWDQSNESELTIAGKRKG